MSYHFYCKNFFFPLKNKNPENTRKHNKTQENTIKENKRQQNFGFVLKKKKI
jgi:hypothetical protein